MPSTKSGLARTASEALDADLAGRVQFFLKLDIERASAEAAPVHRAEHPDIAYGIEPEALRDSLLHDRRQLSHALFRVRRVNEVAVMPVARKVWQPIASAMPAAAARRRIMRQASG
jgi:hypothetical protein